MGTNNARMERVAGQPGRLSRRSFIAATGLTAAATAAAGVTAVALEPGAADETVPFRGDHQAGIATPQQAHLRLAAYDVTTTDASNLADLLRRWAALAEQMTAGRPARPHSGHPDAPPNDPGTALGLLPSRLTVTVGFGTSLFDHRLGLAQQRPAALADLPPFPGERLEPRRSGGDLVVQVCADDSQVAVHAVRVLTGAGHDVVRPRWLQSGFVSRPADGGTPRNLFGFRDGTANLPAGDRDAMARHVWASDPDWMAGGSYLVVRRIRMLLSQWDVSSLAEQEKVFGRHKRSGAPYGGRRESDPLVPDRLPADAHARLAAASTNGGMQLLRRGYSYTDSVDAEGLDAGLIFLAYQRDPRTQFVPLMRKLATHDALNEYTRHVGSAVFACPGGLGPSGWWGERLFTSL